MGEFIALIQNFYSSILELFGRTVLTIGPVQTSLGGILFACIVVGFIVNLYWKGAKA